MQRTVELKYEKAANMATYFNLPIDTPVVVFKVDKCFFPCAVMLVYWFGCLKVWLRVPHRNSCCCSMGELKIGYAHGTLTHPSPTLLQQLEITELYRMMNKMYRYLHK